MATLITCDICNREIQRDKLIVEFDNGEHPHNGSKMTISKDLCLNCASTISKLNNGLRINLEFDDAVSQIRFCSAG